MVADLRVRGSTHYFLEDPGPESLVLDWFRNLDTPPTEVQGSDCLVLRFADLDPLAYQTDGAVDVHASPLVLLKLPVEVRGVFWTAGEVHFPLVGGSHIRGYGTIKRAFLKWLRALEPVFAPLPAPPGKWDYYLEGTLKNVATEIFSLPSGMDGLEQERYFLTAFDAERDLGALCSKLRLRGVQCC